MSVLKQFVLRLSVVLVFVFSVASVLGSPASSTTQGESYLPRFMSLRADTVNLRAGPGTMYPILWVFRREGLPVEAVLEFENWFKVRYADGTKGWVHRGLLSTKRTAVIIDEIQILRPDPHPDGNPVLQAEPGVQGELLTCQDAWCQILVAGKKGWLPGQNLWGIYKGENFNSDSEGLGKRFFGYLSTLYNVNAPHWLPRIDAR